MTGRIAHACIIAQLTLGVPTICHAESNSSAGEIAELKANIQNLQEALAQQQQRVESLERENASRQAPAAPTATNVATSSPSGLAAFNPEIGAVADITAASSESDEDAEGNDKLSVRELELVLGHDIDPYSRLDVTIAYSDFHGTHLEEAYISHWGIPALRARIGRLRQRVGIATAAHRDSLLTVDEPLVVQRYLGHEGLAQTGIELSHFLTLPWESVTHELVFGGMEGGVGEEGSLFSDTVRRPSFYAALKNSWEISDATLLNIDGTWLTGSGRDDNAFDVHAFGAHLNLSHNWSAENRTRFISEAYFQRRSLPHRVDQLALRHAEDEHDHEHEEEDEDHDHEEEPMLFRSSPYGYYVLLDQSIAPSWELGGRYDWVKPVDAEGARETAYTSYLTFHQSEFARWRLQYQYFKEASGEDDNRMWLQGTFAIGVHKHAIQ